ncbi:hypothetical protein [Neobacillus vireti]|uniref:hypothetical protein n=1 Tax=Neobacillus vireti TaxID=220686 RepID=UPI003000D781
MNVRNIIEELWSDILSQDVGVFKLETGEWVVLHYTDSPPKIVEFDDQKEFASYIVNYISQLGMENPEFAVKNRDFNFLYNISKLFAN